MTSLPPPFPCSYSVIRGASSYLPETVIADDVDINEIVKQVLERLPELTEASLASNAVWRDSLAVTGTFRTFFLAGNSTEAVACPDGEATALQHSREPRLSMRSTLQTKHQLDRVGLHFRHPRLAAL